MSVSCVSFFSVIKLVTRVMSSDHVVSTCCLSAANCGEKSGELHLQRERIPQVGPESC